VVDDQTNVNARALISSHETLRQAILAKNQLFFNRWRPENSTYLFLFRKHEQGKNAQEIPKFDPLIEAEEKKTMTLRKREVKQECPSPGIRTEAQTESCRKTCHAAQGSAPPHLPTR
jgi:hypothetical protein